MQIKQVFATYDQQENQAVEGFRYCPFCRTTLVLEESGHKLRPTCPSCGFIQFKNPSPAVGVLVVEGNKVLLGKRSGAPGGGKWALPSGYIEYEEDFLTTAIREMKEETGLDVEIRSIINVVSSFLSPRFHFLSVYLLARVVGGEFVARDDLETVDWFPISGPLPEMAFQEDVDIIEWYSAKQFEGLPVDPDFASHGGESNRLVLARTEGRIKLLDVIHRTPVPDPWAEGEKIPWNDPDFSKRMLREHLSQDHDAASRRFEVIDAHVDWIHQGMLSGIPTRILDLGCGPGLYTSRLSKLGHECVGIDYAPAAIAYAREQAEREKLQCTYLEQDIRAADYGTGRGLVMLIFGEFNVFRPADARLILEKASRALERDGLLLLEPHTFFAVQKIGEQPASWYATSGGLFSDRPHVCLTESFWDPGRKVATERYFIVDAQTGDVTRHAASTQAYTDEEYRSLLLGCGFGEIEFYPSLRGNPDESQADFIVIVARNGSATVGPRDDGVRRYRL